MSEATSLNFVLAQEKDQHKFEPHNEVNVNETSISEICTPSRIVATKAKNKLALTIEERVYPTGHLCSFYERC